MLDLQFFSDAGNIYINQPQILLDLTPKSQVKPCKYN